MTFSFKGEPIKIPGTNQKGEAEQELRSFGRAWDKVQNALPGGSFKPCLIDNSPAIVYDHDDDEVLFAMRLEMGNPPILRWMGVKRERVGFIVESAG